MFWELVKDILQLYSKPVFVVIVVLFRYFFFVLRIRSHAETENSKSIHELWPLLKKIPNEIYRRGFKMNRQEG